MTVTVNNHDLPFAERGAAHLPGHWLLARLGKRVLRPGGIALTHSLLTDAQITDCDVLEIAPGLGKTALEIIARNPKSYTGIEFDAAASAVTKKIIGTGGRVVTGEAAATGLDDSSFDVTIGEAMLTMQTDKHKAEIIREVGRVLRPGGRYAIHELAITPEDVSADIKKDIQQSLARSIKVNARPLTTNEWSDLFSSNGFEVSIVKHAPMALLQPRRILADEGLIGALKFGFNVLRDSDARARVLAMRSTFTTYKANLIAIEIIATKES